MKKWIVSIEFTDNLPENHCLVLNEFRIRDLLAKVADELPESITYHVRSVAERAKKASGDER